MRALVDKINTSPTPDKYKHPIGPPQLPPGVGPADGSTPLVAQDAAMGVRGYDYARMIFADATGFPGYPYLAMLATRVEFRNIVTGYATEITREWIELAGTDSEDAGTKERIKLLTKRLDDINFRETIRIAAEHDGYFGRGQIFVDIAGHERDLPLILSPKTIAMGTFKRFSNVEPMWTTPSIYDALDPVAANFYRPNKWFMLNQEVDSQRLMTIITRPLPDLLKPAFNFSGMSLTQLVEPYVDNWLRTRQSVSDLINNFSIISLATSMDEVLTGDDDGDGLMGRADLFTATRSNKGLMLTDKDREELNSIAVPLSGLHELQAQSQEQMCSASGEPAVVLTGIAPSGFGNVSEGEMRAWNDRIAGIQEAYYRKPIEWCLKVLMLDMFGMIDENIVLKFKPLTQMTREQEATIQNTKATAATAYINAGVISPEEERQRLASDPDSGYQGIDVSMVPVNPNQFDDKEDDEDEKQD